LANDFAVTPVDHDAEKFRSDASIALLDQAQERGEY
jgi:hypothetical protein